MTGKILITGADGFVGRRLAPALAARGYAVSRHTRQVGDIARDPLSGPDVTHVFHLAARTFVPESWADPRPFYETNVLGAANVLEFCRRQGSSVTLVSSYIYGEPQTMPVSESHPARAFNPYAHSKILAEELARYYHDQFGVPATIVRPFNLYGPGQADCFLIPSLIRQALSPECDGIGIEDPRPRRDFLFIDDFVELLLATIGRGALEIYNAGSGASVGIQELVTSIAAIAGVQKEMRASGVVRPGEILDVAADIQKARRDLNWTPATPLGEGLRRTIAHMAGAKPEDRGVSPSE